MNKKPGFNAPTIGTTYPKGTIVRKNKDGTITVVPPRKKRSGTPKTKRKSDKLPERITGNSTNSKSYAQWVPKLRPGDKLGEPPTLAERITDFSTGGLTDIHFIPKGKTKKKAEKASSINKRSSEPSKANIDKGKRTSGGKHRKHRKSPS